MTPRCDLSPSIGTRISPTGPRKARSDDRLRRVPPRPLIRSHLQWRVTPSVVYLFCRSMHCVALFAMTKISARLRPIGATGKSLLIVGNRVKPKNQKYFACVFGKSELHHTPSRPVQRGVS